ncbi:MAG TPA: hypothetical protein QF753_11495 [Victivallales bacterium]|nr:hypothetical protein [Victivallales bacterium]
MKNRTVKLLLTVICLTLVSSVYAETFTAKAKPIIESTISYGFNDAYRGIITYVAREGLIVHGPKFDVNGNIKEQGSLLIEMATDYRDSLILQAKASLKNAKEQYNFNKIEYLRYKKLVQTKSVSVEVFQQWASNYLKAEQDVIKAEGNLDLQKRVRKMCRSYAEYDALVQQVYLPYGLATPEPNILKLAQLNPMGICIKMDRKTARKINNSSQISVYPMDGGKPVGVVAYALIYNDNGVTLRVLNPPSVPKGLENITRVKCAPAVSNNNIIAVSKNSLQKDSKGSYVWKASSTKSLQAGKGIASTFKLKKIYVAIGNEMVRIGGFAYYKTIKPINNKIENGDLIVYSAPSNLNENEEVCAYQEKYLFMPGDDIKVDIKF